MLKRLFIPLSILIALFVGNGWLENHQQNPWVEKLYFGFKFAGSEWVPAHVLFGLLIAFNLMLIAKALTSFLAEQLRSKKGVRASSIESLMTLLSYVAYVIAALFGLSLAGINLTNLTIIAGALSVGIGFGLQNIVNNFVSGIILLIEQPVRTGDFVQVAGLEGTVRKVRIRSTEIITFDHSSVIVPNSQLIADALVNWNLRDDFCRVSVTVGVAYGSDTRLVEKLLLQAAEENELVVKKAQGTIPAPFVQFTDFADSSLNFKLVAYIREARQRFSTASQLRFTIDDLFRRNGVSIPFPQRDLHIVSGLEPTTLSKPKTEPADNAEHQP